MPVSATVAVSRAVVVVSGICGVGVEVWFGLGVRLEVGVGDGGVCAGVGGCDVVVGGVGVGGVVEGVGVAVGFAVWYSVWSTSAMRLTARLRDSPQRFVKVGFDQL